MGTDDGLGAALVGFDVLLGTLVNENPEQRGTRISTETCHLLN